MHKLKFNVVNLNTTEILTREELKNVLGGDTGSSTESRCYNRFTPCYVNAPASAEKDGTCETNSKNKCVCNNGTHSVIAESCVKGSETGSGY